MNKTKIEWCDESWNPVTGCRHECEYCYARGIANRFGGDGGVFIRDYGKDGIHEIDVITESYKSGVVKTIKHPYPFGFEPTFHRYRLCEPLNKRKGKNIFVCSMADLFGEWVPDEWIAEVFEACKKAPWHRYMFLTKNPIRYAKLNAAGILPRDKNMWYGATVTKQKDYNKASDLYALSPHEINTFMSVEPMLEAVRFKMLPELVIIGAETGSRKDKVTIERDWIQYFVDACGNANVPLFMKNNLAPYWDGELITEFPWGGQNV